MFNRDSNTYTTNKNFGHETGQDAHRPQLESRRETEGESPNLKQTKVNGKPQNRLIRSIRAYLAWEYSTDQRPSRLIP